MEQNQEVLEEEAVEEVIDESEVSFVPIILFFQLLFIVISGK